MTPNRPPNSSLLPTLALMALALAISWVASGRTAAASGADATRAEVRRTLDAFYLLAERGDWTAVGDLMTDDFAIYTDGAVAFDKTSYVDLLAQEDMTVESWRLSDVEVAVATDGNLAWARYRGSFRTAVGGESSEVETVETLILVHESEGWRIAHAHASVKPLTDD